MPAGSLPRRGLLPSKCPPGPLEPGAARSRQALAVSVTVIGPYRQPPLSAIAFIARSTVSAASCFVIASPPCAPGYIPCLIPSAVLPQKIILLLRR